MQDSGNPVLDATTSIVVAYLASNPTSPGKGNLEALIRDVHSVIAEMAEKEPGGFLRRMEQNKVRYTIGGPKAAARKARLERDER